MADPTVELPKGAVTLLATDVEGSTSIWEAEPVPMRRAIALHDSILRERVEQHRGHIFKHVGDGVLAAFERPEDALECALGLLEAIRCAEWPTCQPLRIRAALHSGSIEPVDGDYLGPPVNRVSRIVGVAEPDQALVSGTTLSLIPGMPEGVTADYLGERRLKGIPEPVGLYAVRRADGLASTAPPAATGPVAVVGAWPASGRPFVGRELDLERIRSLLKGPGSLVTVTGTGGIGKSRLACAFAEQNAFRYADGAVFVDCSAFGSEEDVALALLQAAGAQADGEALRAAAEVYSQRSSLIVLDCYEALADDPRLVLLLGEHAKDCDVVVTSRRVLRLEREAEHALGPLPWGEGAAEALFREYARLVEPDLEGEEADALVTEACRLLDGVPLLLSIAAARLRYEGLAELVDSLRKRRSALVDERLDAQTRHQSVRRIVADSIQLLPGGEEAVLRDFRVFRGGATAQDAAAVLGPRHGERLLPALARLRDHSLLLTENSLGRKRFRVLDTVGEALDEQPTPPELQAAHAAHFAQIAGRVGDWFAAGEWHKAKPLVLAEIGNFRQAAAWAGENGHEEHAEALARGLARTLMDSGLWDAYVEVTEPARASSSPAVQAMLLGLDGALAARRGLRATARELWRERASLCASIGDPEGEVDALLDLAELALNDKDSERCRALLAQGLWLAHKGKLAGHLATAEAVAAELALSEAFAERAMRWARRAERTVAQADNRDLALYVRLACSRTFAACGETGAALRSLHAAVSAALDGNRLFHVAHNLVDYAALLEHSGRLSESGLAWAAAARLAHELRSSRDAEAASGLAEFRARHPSHAEATERIVRESGWEAAVVELLQTAADTA